MNPVPSCDHTPADRYAYQYMYTYGEYGLTTLVNNSEFANFTQDGLSVYPYYMRKYWLSVDVVQDTTAEFLRAYDVLSGNSVLSSQIELPTYEDWEFSHWEPEVWNPIERDTSISAVYEDTDLTLIADTGESISDDDGNYIDIVEVPKYGTVIYNTGYDAPCEGEYLVDDMGNYIVDSDGNYIKAER